VTYESSGYAARIAEFQGYPVPVFFSEDGCNVVRPRTFSDIPSIYGPNMTPVLSGTIIYEWTQEVNNYGLVEYPDTTIQNGAVVPVGMPMPMQPEFNNLMSQWAAVSPMSVDASDYNPTVTTMACPAVTPGVWTIEGDASLPPQPGTLMPPPASSYSFTGSLPTVVLVTLDVSISGSSSVTATVATQTSGGSTSAATATKKGSPSGTVCFDPILTSSFECWFTKRSRRRLCYSWCFHCFLCLVDMLWLINFWGSGFAHLDRCIL
jgi:1,3-beta-glucanosyltransferase GAS1